MLAPPRIARTRSGLRREPLLGQIRHESGASDFIVIASLDGCKKGPRGNGGLSVDGLALRLAPPPIQSHPDSRSRRESMDPI